MNEAIRQAVKSAMKQKGITQEQMAQKIGVHRVHISRMLTGAASDAPEAWRKMLDEVDLDIAPVPKRKVEDADQP